MRIRKPTKIWSIGCSLIAATVNAGPVIGWIWCAMPIQTGTNGMVPNQASGVIATT